MPTTTVPKPIIINHQLHPPLHNLDLSHSKYILNFKIIQVFIFSYLGGTSVAFKIVKVAKIYHTCEIFVCINPNSPNNSNQCKMGFHLDWLTFLYISRRIQVHGLKSG